MKFFRESLLELERLLDKPYLFEELKDVLEKEKLLIKIEHPSLEASYQSLKAIRKVLEYLDSKNALDEISKDASLKSSVMDSIFQSQYAAFLIEDKELYISTLESFSELVREASKSEKLPENVSVNLRYLSIIILNQIEEYRKSTAD